MASLLTNKYFYLYCCGILILGALIYDGVNDEIYDTHTHVMTVKLGEYRLLPNMIRNNIQKTIIVGSPNETFYSSGGGFTNPDANNDVVLELANKYPDRFIAFCTIDPKDPEKLEKVKNCIEEGGTGIKLFSGHSSFHTIPLNDPEMLPIYEYSEKNNIPLIWHVNSGLYEDEFRTVMDDFPDLVVNCPHFCLATLDLDRLSKLLDDYPNLYIDISFGYFIQDNLLKSSGNIEEYRNFVSKYQDRILFGSDVVITYAKFKDQKFYNSITNCYKDFLEKEIYSCNADGRINFNNLNGLNLSENVLNKIYIENPKRFLNKY